MLIFNFVKVALSLNQFGEYILLYCYLSLYTYIIYKTEELTAENTYNKVI